MTEETSEKPLNLYQRLNQVMAELSYVQKTAHIQAGARGYSAVSHDHVTRLVREKFVKHGIFCKPTITNHSIEHYKVQIKNYEQDRYETKCTVEINLVNIDDPTDTITTTYFAHSFDNQDKSPGKAMSMAVKYALLKLLMLESGDEEEQRVEEARRVNKEQIERTNTLRNDLRSLLKANGKYNEKAESYLMTLNVDDLEKKINDLQKDEK